MELGRRRSRWRPEPAPPAGRLRWFAWALAAQAVLAVVAALACFAYALGRIEGRIGSDLTDVRMAAGGTLGATALLVAAVLAGSAVMIRRGSVSAVAVGAVGEVAFLAAAAIAVGAVR